MSGNRIEALCRGNGANWCVECCESRNCTNLGQLEDDSWGCLGYNLQEATIMNTPDGITSVNPQRSFCAKLDCLDGYNINREEVVNEINMLQKGEFFMSFLINKLAR